MPRVVITPLHHASVGAVDIIAATRLAPNRVVTAVRDGSGNFKVIVWDVSPEGSLTRRGDADGDAVSQIAITDWRAGPGVVTAVRTAAGNLKVIAWAVNLDGTLHRRGDAEAGPVKNLTVSSPSGLDGVVTPVINDSGELKVIAWLLSSNGTFSRGDSTGSGGECTSVAATALSETVTAARVAVAAITAMPRPSR